MQIPDSCQNDVDQLGLEQSQPFVSDAGSPLEQYAGQAVPDAESQLVQNAGQVVPDDGGQIIQFDWGQLGQFDGERFVTIALVLLLIYLLLNLFDGFLASGSFFGRMHDRVQHWVHQLFLIYEPLALLILSVSLVLVSPLFFGLLMLVVILGGLRHLRNYFSGRLVQLDRGIQNGMQIKAGAHQGVISDISRLGLRLKTAKGLEFVTYQQMLTSGYVLSTGNDLGGFYRLTISTADESQTINALKLKDLMTTTPYLDWNHNTVLTPNFDLANQVDARVLVREEHHLQDLLALIKEWGFQCKVSKK